MTHDFSERRIDAAGISVRCLERGSGDAVVTLHGVSGAAPTPLEELLSEKFRVLALESPIFAAIGRSNAARVLAQALSSLGLGKYALLASGTAVSAALHQAADNNAPPETLVLLSPGGPLEDAEKTRLGDIGAPTLVLVGTNDAAATEAVGRLCAERIPECYPMLVYDAASAMATERPAAIFEAIADFIERRGRFILERQESVISP